MTKRSDPQKGAEERDTGEVEEEYPLAARLEADLIASADYPLPIQTDYLIERGWSVLDNWAPQKRGRLGRLKQRLVDEMSSWEPGSVVKVYLIRGYGSTQMDAELVKSNHTFPWVLVLLVDTSPRLRWMHLVFQDYEPHSLPELCAGSLCGFPEAGLCNVALLLYLTTRCYRCK